MAMGFYFKSFEHTTTQHSADNFFWKVGLISLIGLFTKMAKKMRRFLATQVTFLAKFWGYMGELEWVMGSNVPPSIADQSLKVSSVSPQN